MLNSVILLSKEIRFLPRNLALAGNFNLVNTDELFALINIEPGEFQKQSDLAAMMEVIHHFLVKADENHPEEPGCCECALKKALSLIRWWFYGWRPDW